MFSQATDAARQAAFEQKFAKTTEKDNAAYWKATLKNLSPLMLATMEPDPERKHTDIDNVKFTINKTIVNKIRKIISLDVALITSVFALLFRYSQQTDFAGLVSIGSESKATDTAALPLRPTIKQEWTLQTLAESIIKKSNESYKWRLPLDSIFPDIKSLDKVITYPFILQLLLAKSSIGIETQSGVPADKAHTAFKYFNIHVEERAGELHGSIQFKPELFPRNQIEQMAQHLKNILVAFYESPSASLTRLKILSKEEMKLITEFNDTYLEHKEPEKFIDELFSEKAKKYPDKIAWVFHPEHGKPQTMTYKQADQATDQLASYLLNLESATYPIGLCCTRGLHALVGIFSIFKAGAAFVPIEPRVVSITEILGQLKNTMDIMLVDDETEALFKQVKPDLLKDLTLINLSQIEKLIAPTVKSLKLTYKKPQHVTPDDLSHIVYTSGTTGKPKGVENTRRGLSNLTLEMSRRPIAPNGRILNVSPFPFDAVLFDLIVSVVNEGETQLHMPFKEGCHSPEYLSVLIEQQQLTYITLTPNMITGLEPSKLSSVRDITTMGAKPNSKIIKQYMGRIRNECGHSELAVCGFEHLCEPDEESVSIGSPICNTEAVVLDEQLNVCPIGVPGEMYISGDSLARCYMNDRKQTNEKFVFLTFDPETFCFSAKPAKPAELVELAERKIEESEPKRTGSSKKRKLSIDGNPAFLKKPKPDHEDHNESKRFYKTGDIVRAFIYERKTMGGQIRREIRFAFIGRNNRQTKTDGVRTEIDGVEALLQNFPGIQQIIVLPHPETGQLFAYFTQADKTKKISTNDLNTRLKESPISTTTRLRYAFALEAMPINTNTKIDTPKLLEQKRDFADVVHPQTKLQNEIRAIWAAALKEKDEKTLGIDEGFTALGGKSGMTPIIVKEYFKHFGLPEKIRTSQIFPTTDITIAEQATILSQLLTPSEKKSVQVKKEEDTDADGDTHMSIAKIGSVASNPHSFLAQSAAASPSAKLEEFKAPLSGKR